MSNYTQLQAVLNEIFELDKADLDFGIYRIMNQKRKQVSEFIDNQLPKNIAEVLGDTQTNDRAELDDKIKKLGKSLTDADVDPNSSPIYISLCEQRDALDNTESLEQEVFSHLANFFKRYYKDGDFISMRRYKKDVYAIPYEGEEVKLHWANHDQYYIKSSENFKNYSFAFAADQKVSFKLKEVSTEQNNNKAQADTERRFALYTEQPVEVLEGELVIYFTYESYAKGVKQDALVMEAIKELTNHIPAHYKGLFELKPTEKNKSRTLLEKHLSDYVSKNSFDYFIHKDLGGFLNRELDFYIKNEVLYLDDINTKETQFFVAQLSKVKAIKVVAQKIIDFLAQIENFQKKLWLKKKFVVSTNYCITLDRIPESYYPEIAANQAQVQEWISLFAINEIKPTPATTVSPESLGFTKPLTAAFLKENPYLVLDTQFFDEAFKDKLLAEFDDLDQQTDGLLINSENFQALSLMQEKYREKVENVYIDPPFNLGENGDYLYRVDYKNSTWFSLLYDRILNSKSLINTKGSQIVRCNHDGNMLVRMLMDKVFGENNFRNEIIVRRAEESKGDLNKQFGNIRSITVNYDNLYWYSVEPSTRFQGFKKKTSESQSKAHWHSFWKAEDRPNMRYNILGLDLRNHYGQWMWSQDRANRAIQNYLKFKELAINSELTLEEYWKREVTEYTKSTGFNLEFIERFGDGWSSIKYWIPPRQEVLADNNWLDIKGYSNNWQFKTENSEILLKRIISTLSLERDIVMDYFLGSGTTIATAQKLNRKWIGIEMGNYFTPITKLRMLNVLYGDQSGISKEVNWKGGGMFKYQVLESYEDTLNNLYLAPKVADGEIDFSSTAQEQYLLHYMLEIESREHLFNLAMFRNPFSYQLNITENNELKPTKIDLVETFNYLIGMYVSRMQRIGGIKVIEGTTREGIKTLIIWRDLDNSTQAELDRIIRVFYDSTKTSDFQQIYINGDNHLENPRTDGGELKIKLIEETFFKKMFNEQEL